jgi:deoxyribose-phosphate aldolase
MSKISELALSCLDLTNLNSDCTDEDIGALVAKAKSHRIQPAAICIWPQFVALAKDLLKGTSIRIATVVNFPGGLDPAKEVAELTRNAVKNGAHEIDMVIPWRFLLEGHPENVPARVARVKEAASGALVKAILETGMLNDEAVIREACVLAIEGGADFLKTSTGKVPVNATLSSAQILLEEIKKAGRPMGFKPAGGVKTASDAADYIGLANSIMGDDWVAPERFRIGASSVYDALVADIDGKDPVASGSGY